MRGSASAALAEARLEGGLMFGLAAVPVALAVANALASVTGRRWRTLPLA